MYSNKKAIRVRCWQANRIRGFGQLGKGQGHMGRSGRVTNVNRLKNGESPSRFNRLGKMEFPKLYGDDVKGALAWHLQFLRAHGENVTWADYEEAVLKRFGEANEAPMAMLKNLRMFKPRSLVDAFSLSNLQEAPLTLVKQSLSLKSTTTLALLGIVSQNVIKYNSVSGTKPRKQLSQKEFDEKRAKDQ
nr:hypothetical protein [Tanacetum cinerariifolium]